MSDLNRLEQQISQLIGMVAKNNEMMVAMRSDIADMKREIADIRSEIADMKREIADMKREIADNRNEITDIKSQLSDLKNQFEHERELNQSRYDQLLAEIRNMKYTINHHRDKIAKNEEEISIMRQMLQP